MYDRVLAAMSDSPTAERALDEAIQLAQKLGSELVIAHVIDNSCLMYDAGYTDVGAFTETLIEQGSQVIVDACAKVEEVGVHVHSVVVDDPIDTFDIGTAIEQAAYNAGA